MKNGKPFHRAQAMMQLVAVAMLLPMLQQKAALEKIGPYHSRGKGRGKAFDRQRHGNSSTTFRTNGKREVERRQRQIARGQLSPVYPVAAP